MSPEMQPAFALTCATRFAGKRQHKASAAGAEADPIVALYAGPSPTHPLLDPLTTTNESAWQQGRLLEVGGDSFVVDVNPPTVHRMEFYGRVFVGVPLFPALTLRFADEEACQWLWSRRRPAGPGGAGGAWEPIPGAKARRYVPTDADAGFMLRVECTPQRMTNGFTATATGAGLEQQQQQQQQQLGVGEPAAAECGPVAVPPRPAGWEARHALTGAWLEGPEMRVVTYNILADQYAATDTAKNVIFAHLPAQ
jgi:2',5'-phosphodiesterase